MATSKVCRLFEERLPAEAWLLEEGTGNPISTTAPFPFSGPCPAPAAGLCPAAEVALAAWPRPAAVPGVVARPAEEAPRVGQRGVVPAACSSPIGVPREPSAAEDPLRVSSRPTSPEAARSE